MRTSRSWQKNIPTLIRVCASSIWHHVDLSGFGNDHSRGEKVLGSDTNNLDRRGPTDMQESGKMLK
jgi:hypothetical protein